MLLPQLQPYLKVSVVSIDNELVLLDALEDKPVPREAYEYLVTTQDLDESVYLSCTPSAHSLFTRTLDLLVQRNIRRASAKAGNPQVRKNSRPVLMMCKAGILDAGQTALLQQLQNRGVSEIDEDKILSMEDYITKVSSRTASCV